MKFNPEKPFNDLPLLPPKANLETPKILKAAIEANRALGELKGFVNVIPNPTLLIQMLVLQEAKDSSEIENIITTGDELFRALSLEPDQISPEAKEVLRYREALWSGFNQLKTKSVLTTKTLIEIQSSLVGNNEGIRRTPGTRIQNSRTKKIIYTPPEGYKLILEKLGNVGKYIHEKNGTDALVKMAVIHYQFEAIHPFSDGNGRTGRILNALYLIYKGLLGYPVLYLSSYIIKNKNRYYELLKGVTENENWEEWVLFMLGAVSQTSKDTIKRVEKIKNALDNTMNEVREKLPKIYSKELIELLFKQPYCKVKFIEEAGLAKRQTAAVYLKSLEELGILESKQIGREMLYLNRKIIEIYTD